MGLRFPSVSATNRKRLAAVITRPRHLSTLSAPAQPWLTAAGDQSSYHYLQNGQFVASQGEPCYTVRNPATQEVVGTVPELTTQEFDDTVALAKEAFEEWKLVPIQQRQRIMVNFQQAIRDNMDDLAYLITLENGARPYQKAL